ncbi:alpha-amylase family glycosyl hydrolase [Undibacterium cyanobacteriorum]|uniref:Alpha-amylase n=1 Tax=Undibacterium cyanobacteriorum TaxID=3073561 RepID=A0ABY9RI20_9BURK|nr:alpha-amylase family glycosyl hydrolase [Undibacterium sp. 20NA77.5]WMW79751.1 alpha-amylase family glycosyl hydrolase [Undibacterium sp. 20NA77.5]
MSSSTQLSIKPRLTVLASLLILLANGGTSNAVAAPKFATTSEKHQTAGKALDKTQAKTSAKNSAPFHWKNATVYFLLTDRFNNADKKNDLAYGRRADAAPLRGYMGGDLKGVTEKIKEGYFDALGVNALWITPPVEQIHAGTDEGTGKSYGFHGYWARDFTKVDANLGSEADFKTLVETAHRHGIRVLLDVVMNHTGPVTETDAVWPNDWVRTTPQCDYKNADGAIKCTLVKNLPDFLTESDQAVELPSFLIEKWKNEGRLQKEQAELDDFFKRTGYPRAPRYYLMKWHTDWVRKYGIDGFRVDTVKHVEAKVWKELKDNASAAFEDWKRQHPQKVLSKDAFFMTAEAYNYDIEHGLQFHMDGGDRINYYANGFDSMINFGLKFAAQRDYETVFARYDQLLQGELKPYSVLNYISSHDDDKPYDPARKHAFEAANKLLLAPGAAQIYYGDETARSLIQAQAQGDAVLRSFMNWDQLHSNAPLPEQAGISYRDVLHHWQLLGRFRQAHPAIGMGRHRMLSQQPYVFERDWQSDSGQDYVIVALDLIKPSAGAKHQIPAGQFKDGQVVRDAYSGARSVVRQGKIEFDGRLSVLLLSAE